MFNESPTAGRSSNILKLGSLFSGIGGIELGFERTGRFKTIWHCEIEPYPSAVLEKNFPGVVNYGDITKVDWTRVERPDVIVGGFPCQDISVAGRGAGIKEGTRSGLWSEYARAIRELQPRYVVVENVAMLARRGLTRVLGDIAALGYDAEWFTIRASDVGAPHRRERLFIIAHAHDRAGERTETEILAGEGGQPPLGRDNAGVDAAHAASDGPSGPDEGTPRINSGGEGGGMFQPTGSSMARREVADAPEFAVFRGITDVKDLFGRADIPEPLVRGVNDGLPKGLDGFIRKERTKALGNAVVPAVAEAVAERLLKIEDGSEVK